MIGHEHLLCILRQLNCRHMVLLGAISGELTEQQLYIGSTLTQWRHLDGYCAETIVQIFTETPLIYCFLKVYVGGCYYADIGLLNGAGTYSDIFAGLKHSQQAGLGGQGKFGDLVQEYGSSVGFGKISVAVIDGVGECTFDMSEQFRIYGSFGYGSAVNGKELLGLAEAVLTNDSGLMHVAAATGRPVVAVFGSSTPGYTPPLTEKTEILQTDIKCRPCFRRTCKYGHYKCLRDITPEMAEDALLKLLSGGSEAGSGNA